MPTRRLARRYSSTRPGRSIGGLWLLVAATLAVLFTQTAVAQTRAEEPPPADTGLNLMIHVSKQQIQTRYGLVVLRAYQAEIRNDSADLDDIAEDWISDDSTVRTVESVHLLSATAVISPTELAIIAEEARLDENLVQRYLPASMVLVTSDGRSVSIVTELEGEQTDVWQWVRDKVRTFGHTIIGRETLELRLTPEDAMSVFGVAQGLPRIALTR